MTTNSIFSKLKDKQVAAVVCNQWGDTGKGKFVDLFSQWADLIVRGTGGANAGHTIIVNNKKLILHLVPSGIIHDSEGKINIIGRGVAFDPGVFIFEMNELKKQGIFCQNLKVSHEVSLMLPYHTFKDRFSSYCKGIGTTGRGIGPFYSDVVARKSIFVNDLLNKDLFIEKIKQYAGLEESFLQNLDKEKAKELLHTEFFENGKYWHEEKIIDEEVIIKTYLEDYLPVLRRLIIDAGEFIGKSKKQGKKILLEGAQGLLLSIHYGTTKYQTCSDPSIEGLAWGSHLRLEEVDYTLGITKAPYMTRVGGGPFPTEIGGKESEVYCSSGKTRQDEEKEYPEPFSLLKDSSELKQGIGLRMISSEYGATTGRTRRVGWLDLVALRYAMKVNGKKLALTKFDILAGVEKIKLCISYTYKGKKYYLAEKLLEENKVLNDFYRFSEVLYDCQPNYVEFSGWQEDISQIKNYQDLPQQVKVIVNFIEQYSGGEIDYVSVGPDRTQVIVK